MADQGWGRAGCTTAVNAFDLSVGGWTAGTSVSGVGAFKLITDSCRSWAVREEVSSQADILRQHWVTCSITTSRGLGFSRPQLSCAGVAKGAVKLIDRLDAAAAAT